jgi:hypothetical protein
MSFVGKWMELRTLQGFFLFYCFYIYLYAYTLFGPPCHFQAEPVPPFCSPTLLKKKNKRL